MSKLNAIPPMKNLSSEEKYMDYFVRNFCRQKIFTHDGFQVIFRPEHFKHAFYEDDRKTKKRRFSFYRAKFMDWIKPTLEQPTKCHLGWDWKKGRIASEKRIAYRYQTFVVVIEFWRNKKTGELRAEFVTCYDAQRSIGKISRQPVWNSTVLSGI